MSLKNNQKLFGDDPLGDLEVLVRQAKSLQASRLLLLAGKHPVCRINKILSPPLTEERLHFSQTESLAKAMLDCEQSAELDREGSIEATVTLGSIAYSYSVFFGNGSHNFIIFLPDETA